MKTKYRENINSALIFILICAIGAVSFLTSCEKEEVKDESVALYSYGPMPIPRGGELRFIGQNLDKVTAVVLPGNIEINDFGTKTPKLVTITVPQNAIEGLVVIKYAGGEITTKTPIGFLETISISAFSPATIKAGSTLTITGDYLNHIKEVIFTDRIAAGVDQFVSQSRGELKVKVPAEAQTGKIAVSDGAEDPIIVYSENSLTVTLPAITEITPNPVKAGTDLTIAGSDLDLVKKIVFGGQKSVTEFVSQSGEELVVQVPADARDGKAVLYPASEVAVESEVVVTMVVPAVAVSPTTLKNGGSIAVTGTNLDLVDKVVFSDNVEGTIAEGRTETEISVVVPDQAVSGVVKFITKAAKEVEGPELTLKDPVFTSFTPGSTKPNNDITITGSDLDLVAEVWFAGDIKGTMGAVSETQLAVTVPVGAKTGKVKLVSKNGVEVESASDLTVLQNLPDFTSYSENKGAPGKILTINGSKLLLIKELIFPGGLKATAYRGKSDTQVEVYVPVEVPVGVGSIRMITYEGEEGLLPELFFGGVDPIYKETLCFFNFNGTGKDSWWGNAIGSGIETNAATSADGTPYWRVNGMCGTGWWDGLFFRNGENNFVTTGVEVGTWAVRFDLNTFEAFPNVGELRIRLGSYFYHFNLNSQMGISNTNGWLTITAPLTGFTNDSGTAISNPADGGSEFGMIWSSGTSVKVNIGIDNVRFEPIP